LGVILELLFEFVFQVVFEVLVEAGFEGAGKALSNRVVRIVLGVVLAVGGGYGFGYWWGQRQSGPGDTDLPTSFWVSIALAIAFAAFGLYRLLRARAGVTPTGPPEDVLERVTRIANPLDWGPARLLGFALLNASLAVGVSLGYTPDRVLT
jgi:hypothetical protein